MRILQILPTLSYGDGVSNDCRTIKKALENQGYSTQIYAENIDGRIPRGEALSIKKLPMIKDKDIIVYHLSTGTELNKKILKWNGKKIIRYHNITPPDYFKGYNEVSYNLCRTGYEEAGIIAKQCQYLMPDSEYNLNDMIRMGFKGSSQVAPILIPFGDYERQADTGILDTYKRKKGTNLVFVGRLAPNKCQERIIEIFYYYKKYYDKDARLFLVGSGSGMELYERQLKTYAKALNIPDIYFTGHIKFNEILSYYQLADTFVCMSDHEGFCIPLVEAMYFEKPIVALDTSAIGETLNGAGILLKEYHALNISSIINRLNKDKELRQIVINNQKERLKDFNPQKVLKTILSYIRKIENE